MLFIISSSSDPSPPTLVLSYTPSLSMVIAWPCPCSFAYIIPFIPLLFFIPLFMWKQKLGMEPEPQSQGARIKQWISSECCISKETLLFSRGSFSSPWAQPLMVRGQLYNSQYQSGHSHAMWCVTLGFPENAISYICIWRKGHRVPKSPLSQKITKSLSICSLSGQSQALWNSFSKLFWSVTAKIVSCLQIAHFTHWNNANKTFFFFPKWSHVMHMAHFL